MVHDAGLPLPRLRLSATPLSERGYDRARVIGSLVISKCRVNAISFSSRECVWSWRRTRQLQPRVFEHFARFGAFCWVPGEHFGHEIDERCSILIVED